LEVYKITAKFAKEDMSEKIKEEIQQVERMLKALIKTTGGPQ
jgi:hypothetical protein